MSISTIFKAFTDTAPVKQACEVVRSGRGSGTVHFAVQGMPGSLPAFLIAHLDGCTDSSIFCLFEEEDQASFFHSDLQLVLRREEDVLLFPVSDNRPFDPEHIPDPGPAIARTDVLQRLDASYEGVVVASVRSLAERLPSRDNLSGETTDLSTGATMDPENLLERLVSQGFTRTEFVEQPGDMALRGGILDVFPYTGSYPVRVEFFGDEIESIREFDVHTQRSVSRKQMARIVPDLSFRSGSHVAACSLFDYLQDDVLVVLFGSEDVSRGLETMWESVSEHRPEPSGGERGPGETRDSPIYSPLDHYFDPDALSGLIAACNRLHIGHPRTDQPPTTIDVDASPQPVFNSSIALLRKRLSENHRAGMKTVIFCDTSGQEGRLHELLEDDLEKFSVSLRRDSLHEGFELPSVGYAAYTDHQIFNRYHRPTARRQKKRFGGISLRELHHLVPGDFVVHIDHGIGRFAGMSQIEVRSKKQEVVRIQYRNDDVLYVNVNALYKLHKYKGKEGHQPKLTRLGSGQWQRTKSRTKSRVKDIARDLIRLYAARKSADGYAFSSDSVWQRELEASFYFEDTPDQASTSDAVKSDMANATPMDRLVCGDVGFGKTEIAVRAAFKAVQDGKQVAVLVPTTVLAMQHLRTFSERLSAYPVSVEVLSRFRSSAQIRETIARIAAGKADIVIGTQRLLSKDVAFRDLGLLVVDEEQRFGVAVKEKLRQMRVDIDTLTLTATPIPRTLQFSLLGARDLSIISTPPPNRQPIETEIHTFDKDLIRDAILYEKGRGGQIFFIHNRVQSIDEVADSLRLLIPDVKFRVAHGQMKGSELESVMMGFLQKKFDVLVSTNIIENGLDISNANTIIINRADRFGLAELHQLRGRVGRSDRKAFCFLLVPSIRGLTREARQRLQAVEEFSELGSGFQLAMRDLDIRGAGNLLDAEQTGFIEDIGFETYHRILDEAVQELRQDEFSDLFEGEGVPPAADTAIEVEADAFIPEDYLDNRIERLNLYRRISEANSADELDAISEEMQDRFGAIPAEVQNLLLSVHIKSLANALRLPRVVFKNSRLFLSFPPADRDAYFYDALFQDLLRRLGELDRRYVLKESDSGKLRAIVQEVPDLAACREILAAVQSEKLVPAVYAGQAP